MGIWYTPSPEVDIYYYIYYIFNYIVYITLLILSTTYFWILASIILAPDTSKEFHADWQHLTVTLKNFRKNKIQSIWHVGEDVWGPNIN